MTTSRVQNARRNLVFGVINRAASMLMPFLSRTALIYILGMEYVGLNSLFASILQVLNLADLGIGTAIVYALYEPVANDDERTIRALMNYYRRVYRAIGVVIAILGLIALPFLPRLIKGEPPADVNITILYLVYLFNTVISYWLFAYKQALPTAMQRVDVVSNVNTATNVILNLLQVVALVLTKNYYAFLILVPACTVLNNLLMSAYVDRAYPMLKPEGMITAEQRASIRKRVVGLTIQRVCATTRNSLDSIFLSTFLGLTITAMYDNYFLLMNVVTALLSVVTTAVLPTVGNSIVTESHEKNYSDMRNMNFVYMLVSGWFSICLLCLYQPFMRLWAGPQNTFPDVIAALFVVYCYALKLGDIISLYASGAGLWWEMRWRAIAESVLNIALNYILIRLWGVAGIVSATLISILLVNFGMGTQIIFSNYFQNGKITEYFLDQLRFFLVTAVVGGGAYFLCSFLPEGGFPLFVVRGIVCAAISAGAYLLIYRKSSLFETASGWVLAALRPAAASDPQDGSGIR